jgi:NADH:ubiquinone oxidoreductase subunit F (NADH-binding)
VANAAEGEPASAKDATLLTAAPHLVLDGLQLAAESVGADQAYVYVKAGAAADAVRRALAERLHQGIDRCPVVVHEAPTGFVSGEESAVVAALEGGPALPRTKRVLISEKGVDGRPTLLQNAETLAHVALIARYGPTWFRGAGTQAEPGTFLATIGGTLTHPTVAEAGYGVLLGDLLELAGGPSEPLRAVLVGGYHGAWVPVEAIASTPVSRAGLAPWGGSPGAGVVWAMPAASCGLATTAAIVEYLAGQSARQCGPCAFGLPAIAADLSALARLDVRDARLPQRIAAFAGVVEGRGACRHPDGTVRLVRSALTVFSDDVASHLSGRCVAAVRSHDH